MVNNNYSLLAGLLKQMPENVLQNVDVKKLVRAFEYGLFEFADEKAGHQIESNCGTIVLMTYAFGRIFCGDEAVYVKSEGRYVWHQGKGFPAKMLEEWTGLTGLRQARNRRHFMTAPYGHQLVDEIMEA